MFVNIFNTTEKYDVIYADPPWSYYTWTKNNKWGGVTATHYPCMSQEEISSLPVKTISGKDCVLFLWVTFPCLLQGLDTIKKWGFKYKTVGFTWVKRNKKADSFFTGMGYWTRANAEICIIATKGHPHRMSKSVKQICDAHIREHSRKPDEIRERIVELCGDVKRIELFARQSTPGWDYWGNETTKFNSLQ